ncbi:P-loop containing nucleoside triphosphate hydrolase protein [Lentinula raphanica]|nr:P-loop containing nucleoside triphosphate hydrolase protein [Lentinula raphanica]
MPFVGLDNIDPLRARETAQRLCEVFGVPMLHDFQEAAGLNTLQGKNTILDIPTGAGKTIAFFYPLFYFWKPGDHEPVSRKILLVVSPLVGLMESQAELLNGKGIPAVAMTSVTKNLDRILKDFGENKYRVGFLGPEMAHSVDFHKLVVERAPFQDNIIAMNIDEGHSISEWGTDDFRPEYARISEILAKLPSGVPILTASATLAPEVIQDIEAKLGLGQRCERISVSNEKPNVALSVQIMQHPQDSFADLIALFPSHSTGPDDFPQTLIYVNSRRDAELIQDFLRRNCPDHIPKASFEFFHRFIDDSDKSRIQDGLRSGTLRAVAATDALGTGMDFRKVKRVILWSSPRTFNSLIQKIGRCVRVFDDLGEAVIYITRTAYKKFSAEYELGQQYADGPSTQQELAMLTGDEEADRADASDEDISNTGGEARDEGNDEDEDEDEDGDKDEDNDEDRAIRMNSGDKRLLPTKSQHRVKRKRFRTFIESRDQWHLAWFIVTEGCRCIPWNKFYNNESKIQLSFISKPPGARCCDNCEPDQFQVPTTRLTDPGQLRGSRGSRKSSTELYDSVASKLRSLRDDIVTRVYGADQGLVTGKILLQDEVIHTIAERARAVTSVLMLKQIVRWHFADRYGPEVVEAIQEAVQECREPAEEAREEQQRERALNALCKMARKDFRAKLAEISDRCFEAIEALTRINAATGVQVKICHPFEKLPRRKGPHAHFYVVNERPISMANIRAGVKRGTIYNSLSAYADDWHTMFANCRRYNRDDSQIYADSGTLENTFDETLALAAAEYGLVYEDFRELS